MMKKRIIEKTIKSIRECVDEGIVLIVKFTEKGQDICFVNLENEMMFEENFVCDAVYSWERLEDGSIVDRTTFNELVYPECDLSN